jgi:hypothetical protein
MCISELCILGDIFKDLLLLLYWYPFPTVLLPCLCSIQQLSLAMDIKWCNVRGFKLVSLPALLYGSAKHGDMRCLSYETQHEVSSKWWKDSQRHRFLLVFVRLSPQKKYGLEPKQRFIWPTYYTCHSNDAHLSCPVISVGRSSISLRWLVQISTNNRAQFEMEH